MAAACLFLAGKANDNPYGMIGCVSTMLKEWYGTRHENPQVAAILEDPEAFQRLKERVEDAELVLLFTLGFNFHIEFIQVVGTALTKQEPVLASLKDHRKFSQFLVSTANDILKRDTTLVLQYGVKQLAVAICLFWLKRSRMEQPPPLEDGRPWYVAFGLKEEDWENISARLLKEIFYQKSADEKAAKPAASGMTEGTEAPTTYNAGVSSAVGGAESSAAGMPSGDGGPTRGAADGVTSTAEKPAARQRPSVEQRPPAQAAQVQPARPPQGSARLPPGGGQLVGAKRPRLPEDPNPSSSAWLEPGAGFGTMMPRGGLPKGPPAYPVAKPRPKPAPEPAPPPQAASDSEPEEGEIV